MSFVERFIIQCPYFGGCTIGGSTVLDLLIQIGGDCPSYTASKGGISSMTITCAKEFGK